MIAFIAGFIVGVLTMIIDNYDALRRKNNNKQHGIAKELEGEK